jgi:uncharacterized protein
MQRNEVIARLKQVEPTLRDFGVAALYLFGSHARNEARPDSDIDVFVDPVSEDRFGFLQFMDAYETIRRTVGTDVEVGYSTREGLSPYIRANVESEAVRIF